jgi:GNAT superfamily N-acetyltransferase
MDDEAFRPLWLKHSAEVFSNVPVFRSQELLPEDKKAGLKALAENMGKPYFLRLGLFHGEEFVGWHIGYQKDRETFYMQNSAVMPGHRRKGLYSALLANALERLRGKGFQVIYSRHNMTNNHVIIPKLMAGFLITSFELSDTFGSLIHLTYYSDPLRRKVQVYRAGDMFPDQEIRKALGLT